MERGRRGERVGGAGGRGGAGPRPGIELLRLELPAPARGQGLSCPELPLIYRVRPGPSPLFRPSPRPLGLPREVTPGSGPTRHPPRSLRQLPRSVLHIWSYPHPVLHIWSYRPLQVALTPDLLRSPMVTPDLPRSAVGDTGSAALEGGPAAATPDLPRSAVETLPATSYLLCSGGGGIGARNSACAALGSGKTATSRQRARSSGLFVADNFANWMHGNLPYHRDGMQPLGGTVPRAGFEGQGSWSLASMWKRGRASTSRHSNSRASLRKSLA